MAYDQTRIAIKTFSLLCNYKRKVTTVILRENCALFFFIIRIGKNMWLKQEIIFLRGWDTKFRLTGQESHFSLSNKSRIGEQSRDFRAIAVFQRQVEQVRAHHWSIVGSSFQRHWWVSNHRIRVEWFDYSCPVMAVMSHGQSARK